MVTATPRAETGVDGLDEVLGGGLLPGRAYVVRGDPGAGKTILGYHFLTADPDASRLYVAFEESEREIRANAESLGFDLSGVELLDLSPDETLFLDSESYSVFDPSEVEHDDVMERIADALSERSFDRVFIDPLSLLRRLSPDDYQFRREVASMVSYLKARDVTTLFTVQSGVGDASDVDLEYLADGAIELHRGEDGRAIAVTKLRGASFQSGRHAMRITDRGLRVFPKLIPEAHGEPFEREMLSSGIPGLDDLLGGGIERGTTTVIAGPSGVGKSTTGSHFIGEAASEGHHAAAYLFEESVGSFTHRSEALGVPVGDLRERGDLHVEAVEPLAMSADEFAKRVREDVETHGTEVVLIDGVSGYRLALHDESADLVAQLHALARYLTNVGVTVLLTEEVPEITGEFTPTNERISHLADNILFLRYVEVGGELRKAVGILKKRLGDFEPTLRELRFDGEVTVGEPLTDLRGVLTGTPEWNE